MLRKVSAGPFGAGTPKRLKHLGGGGLPDTLSTEGAGPPPSRKFTFAQGKAPEGPGAGAGPHRVAADPRASPHKPRKERRGKGGLPGVERYAAGGPQAGAGPGGLTLPRKTPYGRL
jgi:hypothetical protein